MVILRTLAVAAFVLGSVVAAFAQGKPGTVGAGTGTALTTSGNSAAQMPSSGQPTPPSGVVPQGGTNTAKGHVTNPNAQSKIGRGTTK